MAKYGTKKYWQEEVHSTEVKFELMCRGFVSILNGSQSVAIEDMQNMIEQLANCSNTLNYDRHNFEEAPEDEEEEE